MHFTRHTIPVVVLSFAAGMLPGCGSEPAAQPGGNSLGRQASGGTAGSPSGGSGGVAGAASAGEGGTTGSLCDGDVACDEAYWMERCPEPATEEPGIVCRCADTAAAGRFDTPQADCILCAWRSCVKGQEGGFWHEFGSTYFIVEGPSGDSCRVDAYFEVENGLSHYECAWPLGWSGWSSLADTNPVEAPRPPWFDRYCTRMGNCSGQACGEDYHACLPFGP